MSCLVTKLKATVNNPNLPVFETMQQFTLDAITASGNPSMTDAQKYALNHFFYQMGAIDNSSLWGKIKVILLPMICGKNLSTAIVNYKGNIVEATPDSNWSFAENGGLINTGGTYRLDLTSKYTGSSASLSAVYVTMLNNMAVGASLWRIGSTSEVLNTYAMGHSAATSYSLVSRSATYILNNTSEEYDIASMRVFTDKTIYKLIHSSSGTSVVAEDTTLSGAKEPITFTSENGRIQLDRYPMSCGAAILSDVLSESEMDTVLDAVKNLKIAFAVSA